MKKLSIIIVIICIGCSNINPIEKVLSSDDPKIKHVIDNLENHEIQIMFTEVIEKKDTTIFKDYEFQVNDKDYFYPASTVKFPIAILALEKMSLNSLINRNTIFKISGDSIKTTFTKDINEIFAVSDNEAYTRLFEYLGQDYITKQLKDKGILSRISHRFSGSNPYSLETKPLLFYKEDSLIFTSENTVNKTLQSLSLNKIEKGVGYVSGDSLVSQSMNFSLKNYLPIRSLHNIMKQFMHPELYSKERQFHLLEEDRLFLMNAMKMLPKEAGYTEETYHDSYVKFLIFGDSKEDIPKHITMYNKVGLAYGYLTDCTYIINNRTNRKYIITATIHVNKNQIYNDGIYEYDSIGIPFLAELGRQLSLN